MNEIIKIENRNNINTVNARDLYLKLESKRQFADWIKDRLERFIENVDFISISQKSEKPTGGRPTIEYYISIDCAKMICMLENNKVGDEIRKYFIECEKQLKNNLIVPTTLKDALLLAYNQQCQIEEQQKQLTEQAPKVEFYDTIIDSKDWIDIGEVAKVLNKGIGRNKLFELLRQKQILNNKNQPYQSFQDRNYFRLIETSYNLPNGDCKIHLKTVVSQKCVEYINKIIE